MVTLAIILLASLAFIAWAAPVATARQTPAGIRLKNGHKTLITLATTPTISFWEISVKPFSLDGGDMVDTTTMHTNRYRSKAFRTLIDLGDMTAKVAYDPNVINQIMTALNVETTVTITYPDGSTEAVYAGLRVFDPDELVEGEMPTATITITATNRDSAGAEFGPVLTSVPGT